MRRLAALLIALILAMGLSAGPVQATVSPNSTNPGGGVGYDCHMHTRHMPEAHRRVSAYAYDAHWWMNAHIDYAVCKKSGHRTYSFPVNTTGKYNRSGTHQFCSKWWPNLVFHRMVMNAVYSDAWPSNPDFNPAEFYVPCDNDTVHKKAQLYKTPHKLYWRNGHPPHFSVYWELQFHGKWTRHPSGAWSGSMG